MQTLTYIDPITKDINYERFKIDAEKLLFQDSENTYCIVYFSHLFLHQIRKNEISHIPYHHILISNTFYLPALVIM